MDVPAGTLHYSNMVDAAVPAFDLYGEHAFLPDVLHCETIADRSMLHGWRIRPHRHERLHQFLHLAEGAAEVLLGTERAMGADMVVNLPAGVVHGFRFAPGTAGTVLTLPVELIDQPLAACPVLARPALVSAGPRLGGLFGEVAAVFAGRSAARAPLLAALAGVIAARVAERITTAAPPAGSPLLRRFTDLVEAHYRDHWRVADYAATLGVSATHLSRVCRAETGAGASRVVALRLMKEARRLLTYTAHPVVRISGDLGFVDPAYFTRAFTRSTGMTPTAFRARAMRGGR